MRKISKFALALIKQWEGLRLKAYKDISGVLTIGYGHTGEDIKPNQTISLAEAEQLLLRDLAKFEEAIEQLVKVNLNDNQFAALVAFSFNIGLTAFKNSTLLKKLNNGNYDAVPIELMRWCHSRGKQCKGLINRRSAEIGLWVKHSEVASAFADCQRDEAEQLHKTPHAKAIAITSIGALGASCSEIANSLEPHINNIAILRYIFAALTIIGVGLSLFVIIKKYQL